MRDRKQSQSTYSTDLYMTLSTDHTPATGKTVTVTLSKNCAAFGAAAGAVTEISSGHYKLAANSGDFDTLGSLVIRATATGCDDYNVEFAVVAFDPFDAVRLGLTALPNAAAEAAGGLYTRGSGAGQINQQANGQVDTNIARILNTASAGAAGYVGLDWAHITAPTTAQDLSGTTIKNVDNAIANVTLVGTTTNLTNAPTAGDFTATMKTSLNAATPASVTGAVGSVTGNVGGNVVGSVGSVTADVGITQAAADKVWLSAVRLLTAFSFDVTVGTNNDKTGYALSGAGVTAVQSGLATTANVAAVPSDVWDESLSGHTTPGSAGAELTAAASGGSAPTLTEIVDGVWNEPIADHLDAGSTGEALDNAGGSGTDPLATPVPGSYAVGTAGYDIALTTNILAQLQADPNIIITDSFDTKGNLHLTQFADYNSSLGTLLTVEASVPTDPQGGDVVFTFQIEQVETPHVGTVVSYDSSAGTAVFGLALTSTDDTNAEVLPLTTSTWRFGLSVVLAAGNLQIVPFPNGLLYVKAAGNPVA